jgi:hypothetical protein
VRGASGVQLALELVNCPSAEPDQPRGLADARALGQFPAGSLDPVGFGTGTAQPGAYLAASRVELSIAGELLLDHAQASIDALLDRGALELCEDAHHLKHRLARRRRGVQVLLVEVEVDLARLEMLDGPLADLPVYQWAAPNVASPNSGYPVPSLHG